LSGALTKLREELASSGEKDGDITSDAVKSAGQSAGTNISSVAEPDDGEIPVTGEEEGDSRTAHSYSGRFLVRMPKPLHEQLAHAAKQEHISLNRFVTNVLTAAVEQGDPGKRSNTAQSASDTSDRPAGLQRVPTRSFRLALATNLVVVVLAGIVAVVLLVLALEHGF
jgi:hypothetical protein